MITIGARAMYRGWRWIITAPAPWVGPDWWHVVRRDQSALAGWTSALVHQDSLAEVEPLVVQVGEPVTVGAFRRPGTVTAVDPEAVTVEFPAHVRTTENGARWTRDASTSRVSPALVNI